MKPIFTAKDFTLGSNEVYLSDETAAQIAEEKIRKLIESWPTVYASSEEGHWGNYKVRQDRFKARLAFVEEINPKSKECEHDPYLFSINAVYRTGEGIPGDKEYKCSKCGVSLKQKWEALDV